MRLLSLAVLAVLTLPLDAQRAVSPKEFTNVPANTQSYFPIGYRNANTPQMNLLQVHDDVPTMTVRSISYRRSSNEAYWYSFPGYKAEIEVSMSTATTTAATIASTYASNHGADKMVVLPKTFINFGSFPQLPVAPQPAFYTLPFKTPFKHTGGVSLCYQVKVSQSDIATNSTQYLYLDRAYQPINQNSSRYGFRSYYGWGCRGSSRYSVPAYTVMNAFLRNGNMDIYSYVYNLSPGQGAGIFAIGAKRTETDLGPLGAPGCLLSNDMAVTIPIRTDMRGYVRWPASGNLQLPYNPWLGGKSLFIQAIGLDKGANALGVVTSRSYHVVMPIDFPNGLPAGQTYRVGASALSMPNGIRAYPYYAMVTEFRG